jgi:hypothetical protein
MNADRISWLERNAWDIDKVFVLFRALDSAFRSLGRLLVWQECVGCAHPFVIHPGWKGSLDVMGTACVLHSGSCELSVDETTDQTQVAAKKERDIA